MIPINQRIKPTFGSYSTIHALCSRSGITPDRYGNSVCRTVDNPNLTTTLLSLVERMIKQMILVVQTKKIASPLLVLSSIVIAVTGVVLLSWATTSNYHGPRFRLQHLFPLAFLKVRERKPSTNSGSVRFIVELRTGVQWSILHKSVERYKLEASQALQQLSGTLERILLSEDDYRGTTSQLLQQPLLSKRFQDKIRQVGKIADQQVEILREQVLRPFDYRMVLAEPRHESSQSSRSTVSASKDFVRYHRQDKTKVSTIQSQDQQSSYESITQVIAHLVRDWSSEGRSIREKIYPWCIQQLPPLTYSSSDKISHKVAVLGAGTARLAYDIATMGYDVEAIEMSLTMASATASILLSQQQYTLRPYLLDSFMNEIDSNHRFKVVRIPDIHIRKDISLSYTVGDFQLVSASRMNPTQKTVVTVFFLDTATNIYEYLHHIHRLLPLGGVWINVGPLQWHPNSQVCLSGDEIKILIESFGFRLRTWFVDKDLVHYRSNDESMTSHQMYRPIRFVAEKSYN